MKKIGMLCLLSAAVISWSFALGNGDNVKFPGNKQISLIVPYSAGGASDTTARIYASELEKALPGTITVSNITGASGATGLTRVKTAKPDGYTIAYMPVESSMLRALVMSHGKLMTFVQRPVSCVLLIATVLAFSWPIIKNIIDARKGSARKAG